MKQNWPSTLLLIISPWTLGRLALLPAEPADLNAFAHPTTVSEVAPGEQPRIAKDNAGILHVVFESDEQAGKNRSVRYSRSSDGGHTWTSPVDVSNSPAMTFHADIAVESSGAIDIVWCDHRSGEENADIFFAHSSDNGKTWSAPLDISNTPGQSTEPSLAVGLNDSIHVVWSDTSKGEKNQDIYYVSSFDQGKTWAKDPLLPAEDISNTPGSSSEPAIATDSDGKPNVVWLDGTPGESHPDIFYIRKESGAWTKPINVSHSPRLSDHPSIACGQKGKVFVTWLDYSQKPTAPDIWCAVCGKADRFEKPVNISNTPGVSGEPVVASDREGRVAFVWTDTSKTFTKPDIFARISDDGGADFTTVMDLSNTPGVSKHPDVVISGHKLFVIWQELDASKNLLKIASLGLENLATGPATEVNPTIHAKSGNSR
jgi:hypothetical protein